MGADASKLFRERLRSLRDAKGLSQTELEERIGKEANYITRVETGRIATPPLEVIASIADALDVSIADLFFNEDIDNSAEVLKAKIDALIATADVKLLRKYYRLLLLLSEE